MFLYFVWRNEIYRVLHCILKWQKKETKIMWVVSWSICFCTQHHFCLKELTDYVYSNLYIWQTFKTFRNGRIVSKVNKTTCCFKESSALYSLSMIKFEFSSINWKTCIHYCKLDNKPIRQTYLMRLVLILRNVIFFNISNHTHSLFN